MTKVVRIKRSKQHSIERKHPWVFSGAIINADKDVENGDIIRLENGQGDILGHGHYQKGSITVRMLNFSSEFPDQNFWDKRIKNALIYRTELNIISKDTNGFRLIHGEGDGLPGLIIDVYNNNIVIQPHSIGMYQNIKEISSALEKVFPKVDSIFVKAKKTLGRYMNDQIEDFYVKEIKNNSVIVENGIKFNVDWEKGQKTGFFLDQRENRKLLGELSQGKSVLNLFCYSGGFSIYALKANASKVVSVDISSTATDLVRKNHELNHKSDDNHDIYTDNVMEYLSDKEVPLFDIVIVDPPAFAKSKNKRHNAVQAYKRLNMMALNKVKPGGMLFTFSCSQVVDTALFENTIRAAAIENQRNIKIIKSLSQGPDHPVNIYHPEGHYLKGLLLYVE